MIPHRDEILRPAVSTDATAVPRYNLVRPDGTIIEKNVAMRLSNPVAREGTPISKAALDEMLAASGVTAGTASAYTLAQDEYTLFDGAPVRFRLHTASGDGATLNINGTGAKPLRDMMGAAMPGGIPAGAWLTAYYSTAAGAYVIAGSEALQALYGARYTVDDAVAYVKDVPEDSLEAAEIVEVGGMTRKCANLIPFPYTYGGAGTVREIEGITWTVLNDGKIHAKGTATKQSFFNLSDGIEWASATILSPPATVNGKTFAGGACYDNSNKILYVSVPQGKTVDTVFAPTINPGDTALPYEPYFEGLRSAEVTELESVGVNLIPLPYAQSTVMNNGVTYTVNDDGSVVANGTATAGVNAVIFLARNITLPAGTYTFVYNDTPYTGGALVVQKNGVWFVDVYNTHTLTIESGDVISLYLQLVGGASATNLILKPRINKGTTPQPYTPYSRDTLPIPEAVRALDGYGESNPDDTTEYNAIKWLSNGKRIYSHKGNIADGAWVPLAKEEITDISDLLPADNLLRVEAGGTITAVNEYGYAVPTKITYQRDVLANRASIFALEKLRLAMELLAKADLSNVSGTFGGVVKANAAAVSALGTAQVRNVTISSTDLSAGSSALATGSSYHVYS